MYYHNDTHLGLLAVKANYVLLSAAKSISQKELFLSIKVKIFIMIYVNSQSQVKVKKETNEKPTLLKYQSAFWVIS